MRNRKLLVALGLLAVLLLAAASWIVPSIGLYYYSNTDPTAGAGVSAPTGQLLVRTDTPSIYYKSGSASTAWTSLSGGGGGGTITGVTAGTSLTGGGVSGNVTLNVSLPGGSTTVGRSLSSLAANGTATYTQPTVDYVDGFTAYDEFLNPGASNGTWVANAAGTGAGCTSAAGVSAANHPGIADCQTGSTAAGTAGATAGGAAGNTTTNQVVFGGGQWVYEAYAGFPTLSNATDGYAAQFGYMDVNNTVGQVDGCYYEYDERNVAGHNPTNAQDWIVVCASNSVRTAILLDGVTACEGGFGTSVLSPVSALTLPDTNWNKLNVTVNATGTQADFSINGTPVCRIATNIPTTAARNTSYGFNIRKNVGTTALHLYMDWARIRFSETTPRN